MPKRKRQHRLLAEYNAKRREKLKREKWLRDQNALQLEECFLVPPKFGRSRRKNINAMTQNEIMNDLCQMECESDEKPTTHCANCLERLDKKQGNYHEKIIIVQENHTEFYPNKILVSKPVIAVLNSIYKLNYLIDEDEREIILCTTCAELLANLCEFYDSFNSRRRQSSILWNKLVRFEALGDDIGNNENNSKTHYFETSETVQTFAMMEEWDQEEEIEQFDYQNEEQDPLQSSQKENVSTISESCFEMEVDDNDYYLHYDPFQCSFVDSGATNSEEHLIANQDEQRGNFFHHVKPILQSDVPMSNGDGEKISLRNSNAWTQDPSSVEKTRLLGAEDKKQKEMKKTNVLSFACKICRHSSSSMSESKQHSKGHVGTKEFPLRCVVCKKLYRTMAYLKSHLTSHSNARPFT